MQFCIYYAHGAGIHYNCTFGRHGFLLLRFSLGELSTQILEPFGLISL